MDSILNVINEYNDDLKSVQAFCEDLYTEYFEDNFKQIRELYKRMKSKVHPITDEELEYILTMFPLELFTAAEKLNALRLNCEVVKLKNKQTLEKLRKDVTDAATQEGLNKTQTAERVAHAISEKMVEYEVLYTAYSSVITRVENEQTFSKELIMGAKKVWDSRRSAENSNPVKEVIPDLPEYDITANKQYVK